MATLLGRLTGNDARPSLAGYRALAVDAIAALERAVLIALAPEVPPRRDGLREAVEALPREVPSHPGDLVRRADVLALLTLDRLVIAATRTPEPPDCPDEPTEDDLNEELIREQRVGEAEPPDSGDGAAGIDLTDWPHRKSWARKNAAGEITRWFCPLDREEWPCVSQRVLDALRSGSSAPSGGTAGKGGE